MISSVGLVVFICVGIVGLILLHNAESRRKIEQPMRPVVETASGGFSCIMTIIIVGLIFLMIGVVFLGEQFMIDSVNSLR